MTEMQVLITDDFDLNKIACSGQCFRCRKLDNGQYRFITGDHILYIRETDPDSQGSYLVSCDSDEWNNVWTPYFDLQRSYSEVAACETGRHPFVDEAIAYGRGLRILRQDPWEMLISFIVSQRKSIPAISKCVEALADRYGHIVVSDHEVLRSFPAANELKSASVEELSACGLGYRTKYIIDAVKQVNSGTLNLESLSSVSDLILLEELQKVYGVGKKVANCIGLFAYGRTACVPVDVWISKAIENECEGVSPFSLYGENAGIIQQYVFYYERTGTHSLS